MGSGRGAAAVAAGIGALAAGCGLGPGEGSGGEATLTVTRDYGAERMLVASVEDPPESETVIRMLDRAAETTTRYGGGFVQSIEGVAGGIEDGRSVDWFFFVNGIESDRGAAEVAVRGGDRIWWDRRDWTDALRTPAVVGSWPEPFAQVSAGVERMPVRVVCVARLAACEQVAGRLAAEGVKAGVERSALSGAGHGSEALRLLVGTWDRVAPDPVAAQLDDGPGTSGVFARFEDGAQGEELVALDERAGPTVRLGRHAGLVAALRQGDAPPTWIVTGTDLQGVEAAARLLEPAHLTDRYAVAVQGRHVLALPAPEGSDAAVGGRR